MSTSVPEPSSIVRSTTPFASLMDRALASMSYVSLVARHRLLARPSLVGLSWHLNASQIGLTSSRTKRCAYATRCTTYVVCGTRRYVAHVDMWHTCATTKWSPEG